MSPFVKTLIIVFGLIFVLTFFWGLHLSSWASTDRRKGVVFSPKERQTSRGIEIREIKKNRGISWAHKWKLRSLNTSLGDWFYGH